MVIGTGWEAEQYARALQFAVVAIAVVCGRAIERVRAVANRLSVGGVRSAWRSVFDKFKLDIAAMATPDTPHRDMAETATRPGRVCEMPMGMNAADARDMLAAVPEAGVKHASGATSCLEHVFMHLKALLAGDTIGDLIGTDNETHRGLPHVYPFSRFHCLGQAGPPRYGRAGRPRTGGRSGSIFRVRSGTRSLRPAITAPKVPGAKSVKERTVLYRPSTVELLSNGEAMRPPPDDRAMCPSSRQ